jgi:hypothetical protein
MNSAIKRSIRAGQFALALIIIATSTAVSRADVVVKSRQSMGGQTYDNTTYIKGKRQRIERMNGQMISIQQCDLKRDIQVMTQLKAYTVTPFGRASASASAGSPAAGAAVKGGVVTSTVTTKDTGERKQMFGYTARRIITTIVMKSSPDACTPVNSKLEIDGWYIDALFAFDCDAERGFANYGAAQNAGCQDRYQTKQVGLARKGFAVWEKMTGFDENGAETFSTVNEVVDISETRLDDELFVAPVGFREVKDFSQAAMTGR